MFPEFTFKGEGGGSTQKDQWFTFFVDIELWTQSLTHTLIPFTNILAALCTSLIIPLAIC